VSLQARYWQLESDLQLYAWAERARHEDDQAGEGHTRRDAPHDPTLSLCVFYYCRTITKLFAWGGRRVEDMFYERRRSEACVD
jgi:hypothetical protein